jgi:hypothetical protein
MAEKKKQNNPYLLYSSVLNLYAPCPDSPYPKDLLNCYKQFPNVANYDGNGQTRNINFTTCNTQLLIYFLSPRKYL